MRQGLATCDGIFRRARLWSLSLQEALVTLPLAYGDRDILAPSAPSQAGSRDPLVSEGSEGRLAEIGGGGRRGISFLWVGWDPHLASPWEGEGLQFSGLATRAVSSRARPGIHPDMVRFMKTARQDHLAAGVGSRDGPRVEPGVTLWVE